jgi:transmembrane sensor
MSGPVAPRALEQAADWLVRLQDGATDADRAACEHWRLSDPQHALAWERAERLLVKFGGLPPELAMPALARPDRPSKTRRAAVVRIAALLAAIPAAWAGWRYYQAQPWSADIRTSVGQRRTVTLADATAVTLNTASAIDVRFTASERRILLRAGEILVRSGAHDPARALVVATAQGALRPLGTVFNVRQHADATALTVLEGAVEVSPAHAAQPALVVPSGSQARFTAHAVGPAKNADPAPTAWTRGMLLADHLPLQTLADELARYRHGMVRVDPGVANLRVSGAFPVADTERTLDMIVATYPVDACERLNGLWITLAARP